MSQVEFHSFTLLSLYLVSVLKEKERIEREEMLARAREAHKEQREKEEDRTPHTAHRTMPLRSAPQCTGVPESAEQ